VGQSAAASGVKFRLGPSSALSEKVASGLVWRFGTFDCVDDNFAYFKNSLGDSGSFLDVGSHRFYIAKPFPEEVTDVLDPLCNTDSDDGKSSDFWMVAVAHRAPRRRRLNTHLHRNKIFHL
jgi:hypothetical protein